MYSFKKRGSMTLKAQKQFCTYHSLRYLPGEGHYVPGRQIILFSLLFFFQGLCAVNYYVNVAAARLRESDVHFTHVVNIKLVLPRKRIEKNHCKWLNVIWHIFIVIPRETLLTVPAVFGIKGALSWGFRRFLV